LKYQNIYKSEKSDMKEFSNINRKENFKKLDQKVFDLIIVGGGITGAGIALDAANRGLTVALFEMQDFAQGTSSRSTKLIHGGLRYLEHLEFALVKAVGKERRIVHNNAMHIVWPEKMLLPIVEGGSLGEFTTSIALKVYDFLAEVEKTEKRKMLNLEQTIQTEPLLKNPILKGGALYYEYKTDDSRLTIEALKKAIDFGAIAFNYAKVNNFLYDDNFKIKGVLVEDKLNNTQIEVYGKYVVNATGIWVDNLRKIDDAKANSRLHITKGIHIVVPRTKLPLNQAIYFDVGDNRMVFAIPRFDIVYIGTTDTNYTKELDKPDIETKDVQYLLDAVNRIIPTANLKLSDVKSAWSGLRPLIHQEGKAPSELSRKDEIFYSETGLISIAGGKLTGYRLMAKKIVDIVTARYKKDYNKTFGKCQTQKIKLSGGEFSFNYSAIKLTEFADKLYDKAKQTGISVVDFNRLFYRYGTNIEQIIEKAFEFYNQTKNTNEAWLKAEVWYSVNYEATTNLTDFFIRRTGLIFFLIDNIPPHIEPVANYMSEIFKWTNEQKQKAIDQINEEIAHSTSFKN